MAIAAINTPQIDNIVDLIVDGRATIALTDRLRILEAAEVAKLHAKIGQLVVERDFLAKAFDR